MADKSRDPEALQRQIERTRLELVQTIDELAARVNPRSVARRGAERLKDEAEEVVKAFGAMVRPSERTDGHKSEEVPASGGVDPKLVAAAAAGVGAAVVVTALMVWRRRRRRR
jgi:hypothetical protein